MIEIKNLWKTFGDKSVLKEYYRNQSMPGKEKCLLS